MRHFGVGEANRLVPLLQQTFDAVRPLIKRLTEAGPEMGEKRLELMQQIQALLEPLEAMGVEVKALDGLVDLRALREGRTVYLCWRYGEEAIGFWHELHTGYGGRQPIERYEEFMPTYRC